MRRWLLITLLLLLTGWMPLRAQASCAVHQDLSNLHRASRGVLTYLETGEGAYHLQRLRSWMSVNPPEPLLQRMRAVGIIAVAPQASELLKRQRTLLQIYASQGRIAARDSARHLNVRQLVADFGTLVEALPCDRIKEEGYGSKLVAVAAEDARMRQQIINAGIAWVSFLVLGGSILYFLDRIGIRRIRRTKRFPCAVPCSLQAGGRSLHGHLVDLSRAGAKLRPDVPLVVSGRVELQFGGYTVAAHVRWQTADYIGVKFVNDFNFLQLHRLLEAYPLEDLEPALRSGRGATARGST